MGFLILNILVKKKFNFIMICFIFLFRLIFYICYSMVNIFNKFLMNKLFIYNEMILNYDLNNLGEKLIGFFRSINFCEINEVFSIKLLIF